MTGSDSDDGLNQPVKPAVLQSVSRGHPVSLFCTWFGTGLIPKVGGTTGTLAALPFAWLIRHYTGMEGLLFGAVAVFFLGWLATNYYMRRFRTKHDPREVVIDEVAAIWLVLACLPADNSSYVVGFILFRMFDILKPWPISWADRRVHGGFGVMIDDIMAAVMAIAAYWAFMTLLVFTSLCEYSWRCG